MSDYPFPEIPDDEASGGGGGGNVTIDGQPIDVDVVAGSISIDPGDIEIGAVEIKDGATNQRASVDGAGALLVSVDTVAGSVSVDDGGSSLTIDTDAGPIDVNITGGAGSGLTDAQLRATPVPVSGAVTVSDGSGPLTVDGTVAVSGSVAVTGPLTDAELRATPVPVSGTVTATTGGLTDTQLRATPVPVSGTVTITDGSGPVTVDGTVAVSGSVAVTGPLTDAQLRAAVVPISDGAGSLTVDAPVATPVFVRLSDGTNPIATLPVSLAAAPSTAVTNAGTFAVQTTADVPGVGATNLGKAEDAVAGSGDTGVFVLAVRRDAEGSNAAAGDYVEFNIDANGRLRTIAGPNPVTATLTNVNNSATNVTALAANAARRGAVMVNDSSTNAYIKFGATASVTSYTYKLGPGAQWEMPPGLSYQGIIDCIADAATGTLRITELVAG